MTYPYERPLRYSLLYGSEITKLEKDPNDTFPFSINEGGYVKLLMLLLLLLMLLEMLLMLVLFLILLGESS